MKENDEADVSSLVRERREKKGDSCSMLRLRDPEHLLQSLRNFIASLFLVLAF